MNFTEERTDYISCLSQELRVVYKGASHTLHSLPRRRPPLSSITSTSTSINSSKYKSHKGQLASSTARLLSSVSSFPSFRTKACLSNSLLLMTLNKRCSSDQDSSNVYRSKASVPALSKEANRNSRALVGSKTTFWWPLSGDDTRCLHCTSLCRPKNSPFFSQRFSPL